MLNKTILISTERSGTNYFLNAYSKMFPGNLVLGEIFREMGDSLSDLRRILGVDKDQALEIVRKQPLETWARLPPGSIAKIFYNHASRNSELWNYFRKHDRVIHLIRSDHLENFISLKVAEQSDVWIDRKVTLRQRLRSLRKSLKSGRLRSVGAQKVPVSVQPFCVDPYELESFIRKRKENVRWCRDYFATADYHEVWYEDIAVSANMCADAIGRIYKVKPRNLVVDTKKQSKGDPRSLVLNYSEIVQFDKR